MLYLLIRFVSAQASFALPMDDVPVGQDSAQKIAVFELEYMTRIPEAVKN